jgi:hypothetical protein
MADMGNIGKASQEMIKELQKMQQQDQVGEGKGQHGGGAKFQESLQNHSQVNEAQNLQKLQEAQKPTNTMQAAKSSQVNQVLANQMEKVQGTGNAKHGAFNNVVKDLMAGQNKLEDLMKVAMSGQKLNNQEMIGIQAGVYMYSQQMELTSKVIDKATSGIKQTMNTQV